MSRNVLHVFYVAVAVFVAVMSTAAYAGPFSRRTQNTATVSSRETIYLLETKYVFVPFKDPSTVIDAGKK